MPLSESNLAARAAGRRRRWRGSALAACLLAALPAALAGADPKRLTLDQVIAMAQARSPQAALSRHRYRAAYWQYRTARATFQPWLSLDATAPDLTRSISRLSLPDGGEAFISRSFAVSGATLSLRKTVGTTGGELFVQTGVDRIDLLSGDRATSYLSRPVSVGLRQPLFAFNPYPWQDRTDPLRFEEARRQHAEDLESIAITAAHGFFDLLASQDQVATARGNFASMDTLHRLARERPARGPEDDERLRTELAFLNARLDLQRAELDLEAKIARFRSTLGLGDAQEVELEIGDDAPEMDVDPAQAIQMARRNRSDAVGFERRLIDAERELAQARASGGPSLNLYASYGLSQSTTDPARIFSRGQETRQAVVGVQIPILDWGRERARTAMAESDRAVARISVEQARRDFEQDVFLRATQAAVQRERMNVAARADAIARRSFEAAKRRYAERQDDLTAVNLALSEKDAARRSYFDALRGSWIAYYELRRATLFDFQTRRVIEVRDPEW